MEESRVTVIRTNPHTHTEKDKDVQAQADGAMGTSACVRLRRHAQVQKHEH